jgi:hypothetical protein
LKKAGESHVRRSRGAREPLKIHGILNAAPVGAARETADLLNGRIARTGCGGFRESLRALFLEVDRRRFLAVLTSVHLVRVTGKTRGFGVRHAAA